MKKLLLASIFALCLLPATAQTITMDTFSTPPTYWCGGDSFYVYFTASGSFNSPNYFVAQLSDPYGNWSDSTIISDSIASPADSILVFIPIDVMTDGNYRIRVESTNPQVASNDNGSDLVIFAYPQTLTVTLTGSACLGTAVLNANSPNNTRVIWYVNGTNIYSTLTGTYTPQYAGFYTAQEQSGTCLSAISDTVDVINTVTASVSLQSPTAACYGAADTFTAQPTNGGTGPVYSWYLNGNLQSDNGTTYATDTLHNGDTVTIVMTSNATCVVDSITSAQAIGAVLPSPATPVLTVSGHGCQNTDTLSLQATDPFMITWYQNGMVVDTTAAAYTVAGGNGNGIAANQVAGPYGVFIDSTGNIYVAEAFSGRVQKFPPGSTSITNGVTVAENGMAVALGVWVDGSGNVYVADPGYSVVWKFPAGSDSATVGTIVAGDTNVTGSAANLLESPIAVYLDSAGNLYVGDDGNDRIQKFPPGSNSMTNAVTVAKNGIGGVSGVFLDASGNIFVPDYSNQVVWKFPPLGDSTTLGTKVAGYQLGYTGNIFIDDSDNVYLAEVQNNQVQKFPAGSDSSTVGITVAGDSIAGSSQAQLNQPTDVFLDRQGNIYVTDLSNNRVQKWIPGAPDTQYIPPKAGTYTATYFTPGGVCPSFMSDPVVIHSKPAVSLSWDSLVEEGPLNLMDGDTIFCIPDYEPIIIPLAGGIPVGGMYSGTNITNDTLSFSQTPAAQTQQVWYTYTDTNGCIAIAEDSFSIEICEGISTIQTNTQLSLYPNPNTGSFMLEVSGDELGKTFMVYDMLGRIVLQQVITDDQQTVTLQDCSPGIYVLKVNGNSTVLRFTVTR